MQESQDLVRIIAGVASPDSFTFDDSVGFLVCLSSEVTGAYTALIGSVHDTLF